MYYIYIHICIYAYYIYSCLFVFNFSQIGINSFTVGWLMLGYVDISP